jgi:hypothetical protein
MKKLWRRECTFILCLLLISTNGKWSQAQSQTTQSAANAAAVNAKGAAMHATGPFDVKVVPQPTDDPSLGRMALDKHYHGDLEASAAGLMLTGGDFKTGSAGYVAMEKITGTLQGRAGTFMVQHDGTLNQGAQQLSITIVPGSGTGQLAGIAGKMDIKITEGKHFYELEYTLPEAK